MLDCTVTRVHKAIVASDLAAPEQSDGRRFRSGGSDAYRRAAPPAESADYVRRADNCQQPPDTSVPKAGN
jgi:hypothetical protein